MRIAFTTELPREGFIRLAGNYLDEDNNFQLIGVTNRTGITASTSPHFNKTATSYATTKVNRDLSDRSFSIDMLVKPDATNTSEVFFTHAVPTSKTTLGSQGFEFGKTPDNRLYVQINGSKPVKSKVLDEPVTAFTRVIVTFDPEDGFRFFAGTKEVTDAAESAWTKAMKYTINAPLTFGKDFKGNLLEARVWTKALTTAEIENTHMRYLSGYEKELLAYYRMNEGKGSTITDLAHGATLYYDDADWHTPTGLSLKMTSAHPVELDSRYLGRSSIQDETLMFWFRTNSSTGDLFRAGRIENDSVATGLALRLEDGKIVLYSEDQKRICDKNVSDDAWHHFALCVNRTYNSISVFIDDLLIDNFSSDLLGPVSGKMYLGGFDGYIDEFAIFEQALPKSLIEEFYRITPYGDEMGLMAFLPFEKMKENNNGIIELVYSPNDERVFKDSEGNVVNKILPLVLTAEAASYADKTTHAPVCSRGMLTKMNFSWTFDNTELLLNLKMADREVNKQSIYITVRDVEDLNGNPMASPVTWTAFVDRNSLKWSAKKLLIQVNDESEADLTTQVDILNNSGKRHTYTIESLPSWLTASTTYGAIDPMDEQTIRLSFNTQIAIGEYSDLIYLTDEDGLSEPLQIEYVVEAIPPYDAIDEHKYPFNMSLCAQVKIGVEYDTDERDIVYAFYRNECVGMEHISYDSDANKAKVYLTVYGNDEMNNKPVRFQLWQASTGKLLDLTPSVSVLFAHGFVYNCGGPQPLILSALGSETQAIDLSAGWNWISTCMDLTASQGVLNNCTSASEPWTNGDLIKNPQTRQFSTYDEQTDAFVGTLTSLHHSQMYMAYTQNGNTLRIAGENLPEDSMSVVVRGDGHWSPMPCLFDQTTPLTEALADYYQKATPGDLIKARNRFATFTEDQRWEGNLTALRPGEGYLFRRMAQGSVDIKFYNQSNSASGLSAKRSVSANGLYSNPKASTNMTMIATIEGLEISKSRNLEVFVGNELAAVTSPIDSLYFLAIQSDQLGTLRFETEEGQTLIPSSINRTSYIVPSYITYVPDTHVGSPKAPVILVPVTGNPSPVTAPYKIIEDQHVVIIRNGERYDVTGKKL